MSKVEKVMCINSNLVSAIGAFQGLRFDVDPYFEKLQNPQYITYVGRNVAETDFRYKQVIPYVLVWCPENGVILRYTRGGKGGESRLNARFSIGVGGHLNETDGADLNPYACGMRRELGEELGFDIQGYDRSVFIPLAALNDDSNDVGKAHFGVVHVLVIPPKWCSRIGTKLPDKTWVSVFRLKAGAWDCYENWSQLLLPRLGQLFGKFNDLRDAP